MNGEQNTHKKINVCNCRTEYFMRSVGMIMLHAPTKLHLPRPRVAVVVSVTRLPCHVICYKLHKLNAWFQNYLQKPKPIGLPVV